MKQLDVQVKALKKIGNTLGEIISEVCKIIIRRFKDYLFTIIDEETASIFQKTLFAALTENSKLIKNFGPMYIDFDDYPPYSGEISENIKQILMSIFGVIMDSLIQK